MIQVTQSPFLQALGYAIINSLWQFALLWLVYIVISNLFKFSPHKKYTTALVMQVAGFTWFAGTLLFYYQQCTLSNNILQQADVDGIAAWAVTSHSTKDILFSWLLKTEQFLPYLSMAYLALLTFLSLKWTQAFRYTSQIKSSGLHKIQVDWRLFVQKISSQFGIKRKVFIYLSEFVKSPLTIGFFKPIILIPIASINHLSTDQLEAVILHELAHIKRFDYVTNIILSVIETILFFNPFMQLLSKQIKRERENCCDDWVLQYNYCATNYAKALLHLAKQQVNEPSFALHAANRKHQLLHRVKRMIERKEKNLNYRHQLLAMGLLTAILVGVAWFNPVQTKNYQEALATSKLEEVQVAPMATQVDNFLFNPVFFWAKDNIRGSVNLTREIKNVEAPKHPVHPTIVVPYIKQKQLENPLPLALPFAMVSSESMKVKSETSAEAQSAKAFSFRITSPGRHIEKDIEFSFDENAMREMTLKAEKSLHSTMAHGSNNKQLQLFRATPEIKMEWKKALEELKAAEAELMKQNQLTARQKAELAKRIKQKLDENKVLFSLSMNEKELEKANQEILRELEALQKMFIIQQGKFNVNTTVVEFPSVAYSVSRTNQNEEHNYSFEYKDNNTSRVSAGSGSAYRRKGCPEKVELEMDAQVVEAPGGNILIATPTAPREPNVEKSPKKELRFAKRYTIIRI